MFYRFLNSFVEPKVERLRPVVIKLLNNDLDGPGAEAANDRLAIDIQYVGLMNRFRNDFRQKYRINKNYLKFLKVIIYLYKKSGQISKKRAPIPPDEVHAVISNVKEAFDDIALAEDIKNVKKPDNDTIE